MIWKFGVPHIWCAKDSVSYRGRSKSQEIIYRSNIASLLSFLISWYVKVNFFVFWCHSLILKSPCMCNYFGNLMLCLPSQTRSPPHEEEISISNSAFAGRGKISPPFFCYFSFWQFFSVFLCIFPCRFWVPSKLRRNSIFWIRPTFFFSFFSAAQIAKFRISMFPRFQKSSGVCFAVLWFVVGFGGVIPHCHFSHCKLRGLISSQCFYSVWLFKGQSPPFFEARCNFLGSCLSQ